MSVVEKRVAGGRCQLHLGVRNARTTPGSTESYYHTVHRSLLGLDGRDLEICLSSYTGISDAIDMQDRNKLYLATCFTFSLWGPSFVTVMYNTNASYMGVSTVMKFHHWCTC